LRSILDIVQAEGRQVDDLASLDGLRPGAHACCVVDQSVPFQQWSVACLAEGGRRGDKLFRFGRDYPTAVTRVDPGVGRPVTQLDPRVAFLGGGRLDPAVMYRMFREQSAAARRAGCRGLRLVADMDWVLAAAPSRHELTAFELLLDQVVNELDATVVCAYRTAHFDSDTLAELTAVHPITVGPVPTDAGFRLWNVTGHVWALAGEIDYSNAESVARALTVVAEGTSTLRLNVAGLRFIAVAGIHALVQLALTRADLRLVIEDPSVALRHCWNVLDLHRQLTNVHLQHGAGGASAPNAVASSDSPEGAR
jgi:anti-anti-sigma regulatory factor